MPLRYLVREGMTAKGMIALNLTPESRYEELSNLLQPLGCIGAYYCDKNNKIRQLPMYGKNLSKTKFKDLVDYDPNDEFPITFIRRT